MKTLAKILLLCIAVLPAKSQSVQAILDRYANAVGGRDNWNKLKAFRVVKRGYIMESNPAYKKLASSMDSSQRTASLNEAVSVSTDTVYVMKPNTVVFYKSLLRLGKEKSAFNPMTEKRYYNGKRLKTDLMGIISTYTDKNNLLLYEEFCENHFTTQKLFASEASLTLEEDKVFNNKTYHVLSGNIEKGPLEKNKKKWYMFDQETGLLEVIKQLNIEGDPYKLIKDYKNFNGLLLATRSDSMVYNELFISTEYVDLKNHVTIPDYLLNNL